VSINSNRGAEHVSDWVLATEDSGHTRHYDAVALPVSIGGGAENDLVLADVDGAIQVGLLDDVFFVQPGRATQNVRLDGDLLRGSRRLEDGSVIALDTARLTCRFTDGRLILSIKAQITAGDTAPPDFDSLAQDQSSEVTVSPVAFSPKAKAGGNSVRPGVSRASFAVYTAFVVLATLVWFAFTGKSVQFEFTPAAEHFELPGTLFEFRIADRHLLRAGEHRVAAELAGYYPIDELVRVGSPANQIISLEFVRLPGLIGLATEPEVGAEVSLDGQVIGETPLDDFEIRPGTHQIQFTAERFLTEVVSLEVEGGHERQQLTAELIPSWARISVNSEPPGAEVFVDGRLLGTAPAELELTAGDRQIELTLAGYNDWRRQIRVVADEPQQLPDVVLSLADGQLALDTRPADAVVTVNGEYIGRSPHDLSLRPNVEHQVSVSKSGYETETLELTFTPGARETMSLELTPRLGVVEVTSTPSGADVVIDNTVVGITPYTARLMAIDQTVAIRLAGYAGAEQAITPLPGYSQNLLFELVPLDQTTGGGYSRVVTTGLGTNLRLIPVGSFQMGSSRSQSPRRRNEILRQVELTSAFYLAETEMTNAEFRHCNPEHDSGSFDGHSLNDDDQPVVNVRVQEIFACLNQLSIEDGLQPVYEENNGMLVPRRPLRDGYRLATEAEFSWAMRVAGRGEADPLRFAWGQALPPPDRFDNVADLSANGILGNTLVFYTDGHPVSAAVGSFAVNAVGLYDMGGNVAEWVQDFYDAFEEEPGTEVLVDPLGPETGRMNIVRGPSWKSATELQLQLSYRDYENTAREDLGFRIARNLQ